MPHENRKLSEHELRIEIDRINSGAKSKFADERKGEFTAKLGILQVPHTVKYEISEDGNSVKLEVPQTDITGMPGVLQLGQTLTGTGIPGILRPKKRGRPPGSKNKPKAQR